MVNSVFLPLFSYQWKYLRTRLPKQSFKQQELKFRYLRCVYFPSMLKHRTDVFQGLFSANRRYFLLFVGPIVVKYFFVSGSVHNSFLGFDLSLYSLSL